MAVSDVVASCTLPDEIKNDLELYSACISGASQVEELEQYMKNAGFIDISITPKDDSAEFIREWAPGRSIEELVISAYIQAKKPASGMD